MDSHSTPRRLNILDLPDDVLFDIFDCLGTVPSVAQFYWEPEDHDVFKAMQNMRLVCRRFCARASRLLVPELRVNISPESIQCAHKLTQNPDIAAGIRAVRVSLAYRPAEIAYSPTRFRNMHMKVMRSIESSCSYYTEFMHEMPEDELEGDEVEICKAMDTYTEMTWAWMEWEGPGRNNRGRWFNSGASDEQKERYVEFQTNLCQCYEEYRRKHEEQKQLLETGSFVSSLAKSLSRIPSPPALRFSDAPEKDADAYSWRERLTVFANDPTTFRQVLTSAQTWRIIEDHKSLDDTAATHGFPVLDDILATEASWEAPIEIPTVKLLWKLPIALYKAGVQLTKLSVDLLPLFSNFSSLVPRAQSKIEDESLAGWSTLATAVQSVRKVSIDAGSHLGRREEHMSSQDQEYLNNYLTALLSSPNLEDICINFYGFKLNTGRRGDRRCTSDMLNPAGSVFSTARYPNVKRLSLFALRFTEQHLLGLLDGIGDKIEDLDLNTVGVSEGGGWTKPLDVLRDKVMRASRYSGSECEVDLTTLSGGGFDLMPQRSWHLDLGEAPGPDWGKEPFCHIAVDYVLGKQEVNPVAELERSRPGYTLSIHDVDPLPVGSW
ncbi:hypothetical protein QBC34DRAFT_223738 [Podospora aff. communis PSN243]|uniref:F-box domain-containing protein n=1 Tax=Podospora aff. communis PSN243 TaxID=3040156 RepID=A0AAV9G469_9PEZI|nr:hypothetical protein QBC34DRAFT_223738 [Podospora aff. communis PSN243]